MKACSPRLCWLILLTLCLPWLCACQSLPPLDDRPASSALPPVTDSRLAKAIAGRSAAHPGKSGIVPLADPRDAFGARMLLTREARRAIDVQYYIWRKDVTGTLLLSELVKAAQRGVRVRLLLDDMNTADLDDALALADAQPNMEIRLFNPFATRSMRWMGYLTDFSRLNRRMHNKSFTVDNLATIVGGRNVGDEYFGAGEAVMFSDLDVMGLGPVVEEVSQQFDRYWDSASSYPVRALLPPPSSEQALALRAEMLATEKTPSAQAYYETLRDSPLARALASGTLADSIEWTTAHMLSDDPAKGLGQARQGTRLIDRLKNAIGTPQAKLDLVSPYFVPTHSGTEAFVQMAQQGIQVRILTNSLESTDVTAVHAGYAKHRKDLLRGGVKLYELKRSATMEPSSANGKGKRERGSEGSGSSGGSRGSGVPGSSGSSLHAKTFAVDNARVYVGSFNFDPRSADLNTEMGFLIDSPTLARRMSDYFDTQIPKRSYHPVLDKNGRLRWHEPVGESVREHHDEPGASWWRRLQIFLIAPLPIDSML